jgi:hypothetical protein
MNAIKAVMIDCMIESPFLDSDVSENIVVRRLFNLSVKVKGFSLFLALTEVPNKSPTITFTVMKNMSVILMLEKHTAKYVNTSLLR